MKYLNKRAQKEKQAQKNQDLTIYERYQNERDSDILLNQKQQQSGKQRSQRNASGKSSYKGSSVSMCSSLPNSIQSQKKRVTMIQPLSNNKISYKSPEKRQGDEILISTPSQSMSDSPLKFQRQKSGLNKENLLHLQDSVELPSNNWENNMMQKEISPDCVEIENDLQLSPSPEYSVESSQQQDQTKINEVNVLIQKFLAQTKKFYNQHALMHHFKIDREFSTLKVDYLQTSNIQVDDRKSLIKWLISLKNKYNFQDQTVFTAIQYMDRYLTANKNVTIQIYQLVGIVCLMISIKMHEDVVLTQDQGNYECGKIYKNEMIAKVEEDILVKLDFRLNAPTSLDFLLQILFLDQCDLSQQGQNLDKYSQIQNLVYQCIPIIYLCKEQYDISQGHSELSIALASLVWILKVKSYQQDPQGAAVLLDHIFMRVKQVYQDGGLIHHFQNEFDQINSVFIILQEKASRKRNKILGYHNQDEQIILRFHQGSYQFFLGNPYEVKSPAEEVLIIDKNSSEVHKYFDEFDRESNASQIEEEIGAHFQIGHECQMQQDFGNSNHKTADTLKNNEEVYQQQNIDYKNKEQPVECRINNSPIIIDDNEIMKELREASQPQISQVLDQQQQQQLQSQIIQDYHKKRSEEVQNFVKQKTNLLQNTGGKTQTTQWQKNHIRFSASPEESTNATWNIRSHYGSPEENINKGHYQMTATKTPKKAEDEIVEVCQHHLTKICSKCCTKKSRSTQQIAKKKQSSAMQRIQQTLKLRIQKSSSKTLSLGKLKLSSVKQKSKSFCNNTLQQSTLNYTVIDLQTKKQQARKNQQRCRLQNMRQKYRQKDLTIKMFQEKFYHQRDVQIDEENRPQNNISNFIDIDEPGQLNIESCFDDIGTNQACDDIQQNQPMIPTFSQFQTQQVDLTVNEIDQLDLIQCSKFDFGQVPTSAFEENNCQQAFDENDVINIIPSSAFEDCFNTQTQPKDFLKVRQQIQRTKQWQGEQPTQLIINNNLQQRAQQCIDKK